MKIPLLRELNKSCVQKFYDDFAPTELIFAIEFQINQWQIKIMERQRMQPQRGKIIIEKRKRNKQ